MRMMKIMNNKKRVNIEINRPIQNIGEIRNVIVEMGYDYIYLSDDEVKKLLITGVLNKETDEHQINIRLCLLNMDCYLMVRSSCSKTKSIFIRLNTFHHMTFILAG